MVDDWVIALAVGGATALIATPLLSRLRRGGLTGTVVGGSNGLVVAVVALAPVLALAGGLEAPLVAGMALALALWILGSLIDRGRVPDRVLGPSILAAAAVLSIVGLRIPATGFAVGDAVVTTVVLAAAMTAWRPGQQTDALPLGWAVVLSAGAGTVAGLAGQNGAAALAAGLVGACLGFAAFTAPPPLARLRTGGCTLVGFLAVILVLGAEPALASPRSAVVPLVMLALPLLDAAFVAGARFSGRSIEPGGAGLLGRLSAIGLPRIWGVVVLVGVEMALSALGVLAGRRLVSIEVALLAATAALVVLAVAGMAARLGAPRKRWAVRFALIGLGMVVLLAALAIPPAIELWRARDTAASAVKAARNGLRSAQDGEPRAAARSFQQAEKLFVEAGERLSGPFVETGLAVPVLSPNLHAGRELTDIGAELARAGRRLSTTADPRQLRIRDGTLPLAELRRLEPQLVAAAAELEEANSRLGSIERSFLVPQVDDAITKLGRRLARAAHDSRVAAEAARVLPRVFGSDEPRRYFLAVQNNAEARAGGGFIGNWGIITASQGRLELDRLQRIGVLNPTTPEQEQARTLEAPRDYRARYSRFGPERTWQNVNMSPDLPTVGPIIVDLLEQSGVGKVDGVVTIDPVGLAAILELTGPVEVASWPEEITAENVVDITLRQAYLTFDEQTETRTAFLGDVADAAWDEFSDGNLGNPVEVLRELGRASHEKHLSIWLADRRAQRLVHDAGADAALPDAPGDLSLVTTQNVAANKLDVYLRRQTRYVAHLSPDPDDDSALATAKLDVTLENTAPGTGLPQEVAGPNVPGLEAGGNRSFVTVYSPLRSSASTLDGTAVPLERQRELGYWAASRYVQVPAQATATLSLDLNGKLDLDRDGRYTLRVLRQPLVVPDDVEVIVDLPRGWHFADVRGFQLDRRERRAHYTGRPKRDLVLSARVVRDAGTTLLDRLDRAG